MVEQKPAHSVAADLFDLECEKQIFVWAAARAQQQVQEKTWQAFWRTAVEQESAERVAADLGLTVGAVYIARSRVMARLKTLVKTQIVDSE
jgi:RNA polymerase sigma-70 factor (ECF subfamily)